MIPESLPHLQSCALGHRCKTSMDGKKKHVYIQIEGE